VAVEQLGEAVIVGRDHDERTSTHVLEPHAERRREWGEFSFERGPHEGYVLGLGLEARAHAELVGHGVGELVVLQDIATDRNDGGAGGANDPRDVVAAQGDHEVDHDGLSITTT
jgi:hypothetical protein